MAWAAVWTSKSNDGHRSDEQKAGRKFRLFWFENKWFVRFACKENIDDKQLCEAISRAEEGLVDADLGGGLIKQRVSRVGEGRSGGYRTIIVYRSGDKAFFVYGFAKNEQDNIDRQDLRLLKKAASVYLALSLAELRELNDGGMLSEVINNDQDL